MANMLTERGESGGYSTCYDCEIRIPPEGTLPFSMECPQIGDENVMIGSSEFHGERKLIAIATGPLVKYIVTHHAEMDDKNDKGIMNGRHKMFVIQTENELFTILVNRHYGDRSAVINRCTIEKPKLLSEEEIEQRDKKIRDEKRKFKQLQKKYPQLPACDIYDIIDGKYGEDEII